MPIVQLVGSWNVDLVPPVVTCLVAADEQDRRAFRIERIQHSERSSVNLDAEFAHMRVSRPVHARTHRISKVGAILLEHSDGGIDFDLLGLLQAVPPIFELVDELNVPSHTF